MRINAYILAADPTWIEASVLSYYGSVSRIIVSYDEEGRGWTGAPIDVKECLHRLRAIDRENKMYFLPGAFSGNRNAPMENETNQRQIAFDAAATGADWVLQLDTDEVLLNPARFLDVVRDAVDYNVETIEWPMRVLFRKIRTGLFLEVCSKDGKDQFEYPGPIAARPGARFVNARRAQGRFLRVLVSGDTRSPQVTHPVEPNEVRRECVDLADVIIHNSWGRDAKVVRSKIASWGHNRGWKTWAYYYLRWMPAPVTWRFLRNFHPLFPSVWPALRQFSFTPVDECST